MDAPPSAPEADGGRARPRPFRREGLGRRVLPFAAVTAVGFAMVIVPPRPSPLSALLAAAILALITLSVAFLPWEELPTWADPLPPLAYLLVIGLLRDSGGGAVSGYAAMYLVPVVWLALYGEREHVVAAVAGVGLALAGPLLLIGGENYPTSEWRRVLIMTGVAGLTGWAGFSSVELLRQQTREAMLVQQATTELAHLHPPDEVVTILLTAVRDLGASSGRPQPAFFLRLDGDEVQVAAAVGDDGPEDGTGGRFALADHPELEAVVRGVPSGASAPGVVTSGHGDAEGADRLIGRTVTSRDRGTDLDHVYVPIIVEGTLYGIVSVPNPTGAFHGTRVSRITTIATVGSIALTNALAHESVLGENVVLSDAADRDPLTGVANRRAWERALDAFIERAPAQSGALHIGIIDLDHFKRYNDTHGHAAGDELLRAATDAWTAVLRRDDLLARIGGEEFAFLVVDATDAQADELADRLRRAVPGDSTCSIGLSRRIDGEPFAVTLERADRALYEAKRGGRDRVRRDTGPGPTAAGDDRGDPAT